MLKIICMAICPLQNLYSHDLNWAAFCVFFLRKLCCSINTRYNVETVVGTRSYLIGWSSDRLHLYLFLVSIFRSTCVCDDVRQGTLKKELLNRCTEHRPMRSCQRLISMWFRTTLSQIGTGLKGAGSQRFLSLWLCVCGLHAIVQICLL